MKVHEVKKSYKEFPGIPKGSHYYWWKFKNSPITRSLTYPKRSQLTRSSFLSQLYDLQDTIDVLPNDDNLPDEIANIISEVEMMKDECQDNLDNMPEHLQDTSDSGMLLQERIDGLNDWLTELESVDLDNDVEDGDERVERWDEIIIEIQSCTCNL